MVKEIWRKAASSSCHLTFTTANWFLGPRPHIIHAFGAHVNQLSNGISIGSAVLRTLQQRLQNAFQSSRQPVKSSLSLGDLDLHLIHGSLGYPNQLPKRNFHWFSRTWPTHGQTHRQTTLLRSHSPRLMQCMRCGLKRKSTKRYISKKSFTWLKNVKRFYI